MIKLKSIKTKLLILFLLVGLLPLAVWGVFNISAARQDLEREIANKLLLFAEAKEGQVYAFLDSIKSRTIDFSSDGFIRDSIKEIIKTRSSRAVQDLNQHLVKNKQSLDPTLAGILILDLKGKVVSATDEKEIGKDEANDEYFLNGQKEVFITDDLLGHQFIVASPLTDKETGELLGVLVNVFKTEKLYAVLSGELQKQEGALTSSLDQAGTLEIYLVDREKEMLVHPRSTQKTGEYYFIGIKIDTLPVKKCLENKEEIATTYTNYAQQQVIGASMCFPQRGWTLVAEITTEEAFLPIVEMETRLGITAAFLIVIVILVTFLIAFIFTRPIKYLHEATEVIAQGNLTYRVNIKTGDEIEQLASAFNDMVQKLEESHSGLEEKVREKTKELAKKIEDIGKTNKSLADAESAMLNILEDARELEKELAEEKESVERKVVERTRELGEEQARLMASLNSISFGFIIADTTHHIIIKNQAVAKILGITDESMTMVNISGIFQGTVNLLEQSERCIMERRNIDIPEIMFGSKFLKLFIAPIIMIRDHNEVIGYVLLFQDITEAKVIERSREEFFAVASHELRTPLTAIRGNSEMIQDLYKDKIVDKDMAGMISDIHEASTRLIGIVNDFLDVSRLEQGKTMFKKEPVDILPIIRETCKEIEPLAKAKNLVLTFNEPKETIPLALTDSTRIKQAISNLIDNAVKYTEKGTITVIVEKDGNSVAVSVTDTGKGISPENQSLLFRKFQQAGEEILTRDVSKSTGLGLYITKLVVEAMGGKVSLAKSALGEGSTFRLTMPIASR
ncbi:MAG: ATP-binding protein [Patescibacteria group bacterium]